MSVSRVDYNGSSNGPAWAIHVEQWSMSNLSKSDQFVSEAYPIVACIIGRETVLGFSYCWAEEASAGDVILLEVFVWDGNV